MAKRLPKKDVVIIGLGWTGSIMANELTDEGLEVMAIERGPWRDAPTDFPPAYMQDELRYRVRRELFLRPDQLTFTFRNKMDQTALPIRSWGAFMPPNGVGGGGVHWNAEMWRFLPSDFVLKTHLTQRYGAAFLPEGMTIQDWGITYDELEPFYDRFEHLCGTSGTAGNLRGQIMEGGNPFEGPRSRPYPTPPQAQPFSHTLFGKVAPNITPDPETGIGSWSDEAFDAAVRHGIRRNGSRLYPAMPYNAYTKMSRDDVLAIRAYLNTVTPVRNAAIANTLPFPFNIRAAMRVWDALYFKEGDYRPDPNQSAEWNRGAFLVDGPAHCGACHTPKTFLGGDKTNQYLEGAYLQGWSAPDITNDARLGLGQWSKENIVSYLRSGHNHITAATGPMGEVVTLSTAQMTDPDLNAIATYLKLLPGRTEAASALAPNDPAMVAGGAIYRDQCSACHGLDGKGVAELFPSIADSSMVKSNDPTTSIRIILRGARSVGTTTQPTASGMPSYGRQLNDEEVAAVLTYMRNSWGGAANPVTSEQVSKVRLDTALRPD